jgi:hypothetical protein
MRLLTLIVLASWGSAAYCWAPATHVYLADRATGLDIPEVHFGAMLADLNQMVVDDSEVFDAIRHLAHYEFDRIPPSCLGLGFTTHNELWGADAYSHEYFLSEDPDHANLYATQKIRHLSDRFGISLDEAEFLFEFAVDYLLRVDEGPVLGRKMRAAAAAFGPRQQQDVVTAFAPPLQEMLPALGQREAEAEVRTAACRYRDVTKLYGAVFARRDDGVFRALTQLTTFYLGYDPAVAEERLGSAVELCRDDYRAELDRVGDLLRVDMRVYVPEATVACPGGCMGPKENSRASADPTLAALLVLGIARAAARVASGRRQALRRRSPDITRPHRHDCRQYGRE